MLWAEAHGAAESASKNPVIKRNFRIPAYIRHQPASFGCEIVQLPPR
jgi:hypothetical protein